MYKTLNEELRDKYPGIAKKALKQPLSAIRLFCLECQGGSLSEVKECICKDCQLYPFRMGKGFGKRPKEKKEIKKELTDENT